VVILFAAYWDFSFDCNVASSGLKPAVAVAVGIAVVATDAFTVGVTLGVGVASVGVLTQPVVDARTNAPINSKGSAYFNGILMYRFIILAI